VLAKRKLEEEQKKRVEEEQRIQQMIEEAKLADPDAPIELVREVVFQQL
jgi:transcription initiation factor TFIID subunit TAF12